MAVAQFYHTYTDRNDFALAACALPVGIVSGTAVQGFLWTYLPPLLPATASSNRRLLYTCVAAVLLWLCSAVSTITVMDAAQARGAKVMQATAIGALVLHVAIGLFLSRGYVAQPKVGKWPTLGQLLQRGGLTAAVWLLVLGTTEAYPAAAGVLLLIPLWAWSTWVAVWTTHGEA